MGAILNWVEASSRDTKLALELKMEDGPNRLVSLQSRNVFGRSVDNTLQRYTLVNADGGLRW